MGKRGPTAPAPTKPMSDKDFEQLVGLIRIQCTAEEISNVFGMGIDTLNTRIAERGIDGVRNFSELYKKHADEGRASLRREQWKLAQAGNPTMLIWLGKQMLGQRDKTALDHTSSDGSMSPTFVTVYESKPGSD